MILKIKKRLLVFILFIKYSKKEQTFDEAYYLKKDCQKQVEGYYEL